MPGAESLVDVFSKAQQSLTPDQLYRAIYKFGQHFAEAVHTFQIKYEDSEWARAVRDALIGRFEPSSKNNG